MKFIYNYNRQKRIIGVALLLVISCFGCQKKDIQFGNNSLTEDPNISNIDTLGVAAYTFQSDSFSTLNTGYFIAGNHYDTAFGSFQSTAYFDLNVPYDSTSTLENCTSCYFDSIVSVVKFSGGYYGDTTRSFTLNVNQLTQEIADDNSFGYNVHSRTYRTAPVGSFSGVISPSRQNTVRIKLSDALGKDLFNKMQSNSDVITSSDDFLNYIKGFCFTGSTSDNTVYYLRPVNDTDFVILYYHKNAPLPQLFSAKFPLNTAHQFNGYVTNYTGTNLSVLASQKAKTIASNQLSGYTYLYGNGGLYPKFNFPSLFSLKELNNYIDVVNATLEIYPVAGSYGYHSFYTLPPALIIYVVNEVGETQGHITNSSGNDLQTGNLSIDYVYNQNTKYTYDITSYVNTVLKNGTPLYLFVQPPNNAIDSIEHRLILNNASFKLKLNVLGL